MYQLKRNHHSRKQFYLDYVNVFNKSGILIKLACTLERVGSQNHVLLNLNQTQDNFKYMFFYSILKPSQIPQKHGNKRKIINICLAM